MITAITALSPTGLCQCGCGQKTNIAKKTDKRLGHVKGQHVFYVNGHTRKGVVPDPNPVQHLPGGLSVIEIIHKDKTLQCLIDTSDYPLEAGVRRTFDTDKMAYS